MGNSRACELDFLLISWPSCDRERREPPPVASPSAPILVVLGLMALRAVKFYAQFVVRTLRNVGPRASAAPVV